MCDYIETLNRNKNDNGGGLAINITGKFESNRHAIAKVEKVTFGEAVKALKLKKNGGLDISSNYLLEIYTEIFGTPEWHHAGKLPKKYGGGMKKTYFLDKIPTKKEVDNWISKYQAILKEKAEKKVEEENRNKTRTSFIKKHGNYFSRLQNVPKFSFVEREEMQGKYGWFEAQPYKYNLPIYYSGVYFKSQKTLDKYNKL